MSSEFVPGTDITFSSTDTNRSLLEQILRDEMRRKDWLVALTDGIKRLEQELVTMHRAISKAQKELQESRDTREKTAQLTVR